MGNPTIGHPQVGYLTLIEESREGAVKGWAKTHPTRKPAPTRADLEEFLADLSRILSNPYRVGRV